MIRLLPRLLGLLVVSSMTLLLAHAQAPAGFDCAARNFTLQYGIHLMQTQGSRSPRHVQDLFDSLELGPMCNQPNPSSDVLSPSTHRMSLNAAARTVYVSPSGSDSNDGSMDKPFATIQRGIDDKQAGESGLNVVVRSGTYELSAPLSITSKASGVTVTKYDKDTTPAVVSGAKSFTPTWSTATETDLPHLGARASSVLVADVSSFNLGDFNTLFVPSSDRFAGFQRAIRAKHPNGNPELHDLYAADTGYIEKAKSWLPVSQSKPSKVVTSDMLRNTTRYSNYSLGYGGTVTQFDPPASYWGTLKPVAGGGSQYVVPTGLTYSDGDFPTTQWSDPTTGHVFAYHGGHWGSWVFDITGADPAKRQITFGRGGFQEARGHKTGAQYYVENIKELLDSPLEWYLDTTAQKLYFYPNGTTPTTLAASQIPVLLTVNGSSDVTVSGLTFAWSSATYMESFQVPSAGDWSISNVASVIVTHATRTSVLDNVFDSVGGNGVMVKEFAADTVIDGNEFVWTGDSACVVVGANQYETAKPWDHTAGNYPMRTNFTRNYAHQLGVYVKQVAGYFQAMAAASTVSQNIIYNAPRSGINANDGFVGGNIYSDNLVSNVVRTTVDHGPFNSWDRQPFLFKDLVSGEVTSQSQMSKVVRNLLFGAYGGVKSVDHDDGSGFYADGNNAILYGSLKLKGENVTTTGNVVLMPTWGYNCVHEVVPIKDPAGLGYHDNRCVLSQGSSPYALSDCEQSYITMSGNELYTPSGDATIKCGRASQSWEQWVASGRDKGSTIHKGSPDTSTMLQWCAEALQFSPGV